MLTVDIKINNRLIVTISAVNVGQAGEDRPGDFVGEMHQPREYDVTVDLFDKPKAGRVNPIRFTVTHDRRFGWQGLLNKITKEIMPTIIETVSENDLENIFLRREIKKVLAEPDQQWTPWREVLNLPGQIPAAEPNIVSRPLHDTHSATDVDLSDLVGRTFQITNTGYPIKVVSINGQKVTIEYPSGKRDTMSLGRLKAYIRAGGKEIE